MTKKSRFQKRIYKSSSRISRTKTILLVVLCYRPAYTIMMTLLFLPEDSVWIKWLTFMKINCTEYCSKEFWRLKPAISTPVEVRKKYSSLLCVWFLDHFKINTLRWTPQKRYNHTDIRRSKTNLQPYDVILHSIFDGFSAVSFFQIIMFEHIRKPQQFSIGALDSK